MPLRGREWIEIIGAQQSKNDKEGMLESSRMFAQIKSATMVLEIF